MGDRHSVSRRQARSVWNRKTGKKRDLRNPRLRALPPVGSNNLFKSGWAGGPGRPKGSRTRAYRSQLIMDLE
jgi:hypothetical protein